MTNSELDISEPVIQHGFQMMLLMSRCPSTPSRLGVRDKGQRAVRVGLRQTLGKQPLNDFGLNSYCSFQHLILKPILPHFFHHLVLKFTLACLTLWLPLSLSFPLSPNWSLDLH